VDVVVKQVCCAAVSVEVRNTAGFSCLAYWLSCWLHCGTKVLEGWAEKHFGLVNRESILETEK
jgi:hypothetical protein